MVVWQLHCYTSLQNPLKWLLKLTKNIQAKKCQWKVYQARTPWVADADLSIYIFCIYLLSLLSVLKTAELTYLQYHVNDCSTSKTGAESIELRLRWGGNDCACPLTACGKWRQDSAGFSWILLLVYESNIHSLKVSYTLPSGGASAAHAPPL